MGNYVTWYPQYYFAHGCQIVNNILVSHSSKGSNINTSFRYHAHDDHLGLNAYTSNGPSPYLTPRGINMTGGLGLFEN